MYAARGKAVFLNLSSFSLIRQKRCAPARVLEETAPRVALSGSCIVIEGNAYLWFGVHRRACSETFRGLLPSNSCRTEK